MLSANLPKIVASVATAERTAKRAGESALKAATKDLHEESWKLVKARYHRLPKSADKESITSFRHATQRYFLKDSSSNLTGVFKASTKPYSLIHAVVGSRRPRPQAGIPVKRRRKIYVKIAGNKKPLGKGQYIAAPIKQRAQNITQVFFKNKQRKYLKGTYSSIYNVLLFPENQDRLAHAATRSFLKNYWKKLEVAL